MTATLPWPSRADLGGQSGHGLVVPEPEGELFHAAWEPRVLALTLAMGATGAWNIDASRAVRETLPAYAQLSYYEIWFTALQRLMIQRDLLSADEAADGQPRSPGRALPRRLAAAEVPAALARGSATERPAYQLPRYALGDAVITRAGTVGHHTRLPGYAAGKRGVIERVHGTHVYADSHAQGLGEQAQWLYTVAFDGRELWGPDAAPGLRVSVDAWEPYLELA